MYVVATVHVPKVEDARNPVAVTLIRLHENVEVIEVTMVNALEKKERKWFNLWEPKYMITHVFSDMSSL